MRIAPVGIVYNDSEKAFHFGCQFADITHGHPTGYLAAGTFATLISLIISGNSLVEAIENSILILKREFCYLLIIPAIVILQDQLQEIFWVSYMGLILFLRIGCLNLN